MTGGSKGRVLVVDDEPAIRLLCRVNLELDGYEVLEAATLAEARECLARTALDAVVVDLHLGRETSHELIADCAGRMPPIPVAVITGSTDASGAERAGAGALLPKPFAIGELSATVERLTAQATAAR